MGTPTFLNRMRKELADLERDPPPLVTCYPTDDDITQLEAYLIGPPNTPYEKGIFRLDVNMPENYPFDPPMIRFRTPIYHPNIDECGRICASVLKKGKDHQWKPSMNLRTTLLSLHALIGEPNPDDPLDADIAREYQQDYDLFVKKAREHTKKYAVDMPDNLIPDPYTDSTTRTTKTIDMDLNNDLLSTSMVDDTSVATGSKPKGKSRLSLSRKKQPNSQSTTSSSFSTQDSSGNSVISNITKQSETNGPLTLNQIKGISPQQPIVNVDNGPDSNNDDDAQTKQDLSKRENESTAEKDDNRGESTTSNATVGSRKKTITKQEDSLNDGMGDVVVNQPSFNTLEVGARIEGDMHEQVPNGEECAATEPSSREAATTDKDAENEDRLIPLQGNTGHDTHVNDQEKQMRNGKDEVGKHVICIDLDDNTINQEQLEHDKVAYISSDESNTGEKQTTMDLKMDSNNKSEKGRCMNEMDGTCQKEVIQGGLIPTPSSPMAETLEAPSDIIPNATQLAVTSTSAAPLFDTPSTSKEPPPSSNMELNNTSLAIRTTLPGSPLKIAITDDMAGWTYSNHYSTHHLVYATDDPFAAEFPAFREEEEQRPIAPKRKSKLSLSCKKKPKTT